MTTAPFSAGVAAAITRSHGQILRARAEHPDFDAPLELDVTADGSTVTLELATDRAPRVVATITAALEHPTAGLALLDPRKGVRVTLELGYALPDGTEEVFPLFDLGLRTARRQRPGDTVTLTAASDEALAVDGAPAALSSVTAATHSAAIIALLAQIMTPDPVVTATVTGGSITIDTVEDRWDGINDIADRIAARVYDDGTRAWHIDPAPALAATDDLALTVGEGGTIIEDDDQLDRDDWHNYVTLIYRWRDSTDVDRQITATAYVNAGDYAITGPAGKRIRREDRRVATTQAAANAAAASILARDLARSRRLTVTAVAAYWIRPDSTVSVVLEAGQAPTRYLVDRVRFSPLAGTMTLELTAPLDTAGLIATSTPAGSAKTADPVAPTRKTYTSTWAATGWATYKGNGTKRADLTTEVAQGYFDGTNTNQSAVLTFNAANSTGSETGKTITQALTGATVTKVSVSMTATWSYRTAGGTARVGMFRGSAVPATFTSPAPYVTSTDWRKGVNRTLPLTSSSTCKGLQDGTIRGVTLGYGVGTDSTYYMKFDPNTFRLTITYSK